MKTSGVKSMVREVLETLETPYTEHVIDHVFQAIEQNPKFLARYAVLCDELGKTVVNNWCGQWVAHALGKTGKVQVASRRNSLVGSYSLMDTDAVTVACKPNEEEAGQLMYEYFQANKGRLPSSISLHRDAIIELIMAGVTAENAFSAVTLSGKADVN